MVERYNRRSTVGIKPTDASVDSILTEIDTEDRYRFNEYGRWEFVPPISLKSKRIQTLFIPITNQTGLIFGDGGWQTILAELHSSGCMIYQIRTTLTDTVTRGSAFVNDFAQVELLPKIQMVFSFNDTSDKCSAFIGLHNDVNAHPVDNTTMANNDQALIGLGFRTSDTNYMIFHNDSSGAFTAVDTLIARDTNVYKLEIEYETSTSVRLSLFDINMDLVFEDTYTIEIPGSGIDLAFRASIINVDTVKRYVINMFDYIRLEKTRPPLSATTDF